MTSHGREQPLKADWSKRVRMVAAWLAALYLARMYVGMGWVKFDPDGFWTEAFVRWGYPEWLRLLVGAIEVAGGVLILVPWVATWGAAGLVTVMIGAGATRLRDGNMVDVGFIALYSVALLWIAYEFWSWRFPRWPRNPTEEASSLTEEEA